MHKAKKNVKSTKSARCIIRRMPHLSRPRGVNVIERTNAAADVCGSCEHAVLCSVRAEMTMRCVAWTDSRDLCGSETGELPTQPAGRIGRAGRIVSAVQRGAAARKRAAVGSSTLVRSHVRSRRASPVACSMTIAIRCYRTKGQTAYAHGSIAAKQVHLECVVLMCGM